MLKLSVLTLFLSALFISPFSKGEKYTLNSNSIIEVTGTSTLHDWSMKMEKPNGQALFGFGDDGQLSIEGLKITLQAENLKSDHKGMDKNAYKAMKTDQYPNIVFEMTRLDDVRSKGDGYKVSCIGKLTIAGTTKVISIPATIKTNPDGSFTSMASKALKMTDFGIDPPTAVLGTIKTGDDITISYTATFNKFN